ncbi:hypothetical protein WR25_22651 [Diploscapter pachys]|uniref:Uncharacterized protein n=1 Tax=Diploscapter pachys TaxID=2018661 RepID=A0A2A2KDK6_9BILA|nr:hypothetical protein WR25_22651 [Diploscapter pachys]
MDERRLAELAGFKQAARGQIALEIGQRNNHLAQWLAIEEIDERAITAHEHWHPQQPLPTRNSRGYAHRPTTTALSAKQPWRRLPKSKVPPTRAAPSETKPAHLNDRGPASIRKASISCTRSVLAATDTLQLLKQRLGQRLVGKRILPGDQLAIDHYMGLPGLGITHVASCTGHGLGGIELQTLLLE